MAVRSTKCFVAEITPGFLEQYHLQKQYVPARQTGEAMAVRSTQDATGAHRAPEASPPGYNMA
jgi:hypothetical protein